MLAPYFADVDMDRQSVMLAEFLALAFGGPHAYTGRDLRTAHARLAGTDRRALRPGCRSPGEVPSASSASPTGDIATVGAVAETVRADVLNR